MFIWDFIADTVLGQIIDWIYGQIVGFLGDFFMQMGNMGADLFEMGWVKSIVLFFSYLAWALYATGLVVAVFECGIECQSGRGSFKETGLNAIKGFLAVGLFSTGFGSDFGAVAASTIESLKDAGTWQDAASAGVFGGLGSITSPILMIFILIMMGYAVIKVFFGNLKRGGILLIQIAVGSLYMFSVPRGYIDGFTGWCKQVIGLCLTTFLQATILVAGLMVVKDHALLGLGLMLSSGEVPRIAGQFGLDTGTRANVMGAVYAAQGAVNLTRTIVQTVK